VLVFEFNSHIFHIKLDSKSHILWDFGGFSSFWELLFIFLHYYFVRGFWGFFPFFLINFISNAGFIGFQSPSFFLKKKNGSLVDVCVSD